MKVLQLAVLASGKGSNLLAIIKAIENDKSRLLIGLDAKILSFIERLMPVSYWSVIGKLMKR